MKMIHYIFYAIQFVILAVTLFFVVFYFLASPLTIGDKHFQLLFVVLISYPFVFYLAIVLSKYFSPAFSYLTLINIAVCLYILLFPLRPLSLGFFVDSPELIKIKERQIEEFQNASKDFLCSDGTFISLSPGVARDTDGQIVRNILFAGKRQLDKPDDYPLWEIGWIVGNGTALSTIQMGDEGVSRAVNTCINSDGKTLLEVYPENKLEKFYN